MGGLYAVWVNSSKKLLEKENTINSPLPCIHTAYWDHLPLDIPGCVSPPARSHTDTHTAILFHKPKYRLWQPNACSFRRDLYTTYFHVGSTDLRWLILKSHLCVVVKLKTQQCQCHRAAVREREMPFSRHLEEFSLQSFKPLKHTHLKALVFLLYSWGSADFFPCHAGTLSSP